MPRMIDSPTRFRFTQKALEEVPPHDPASPSAQLELSDAECVGLRFNKSKSGRSFWMFRYRWQGRKCVLRIGEFPGMNLKQARERGWEIRGLLARGENPRVKREQKAAAMTIGEFAEKHYYPHMRATVRRPDTIESRLNTGALLHFKGRLLTDIGLRDVQQFHAAMKARLSPTTANHHLVTLKAMLNCAVKWEMLEKNPCVGIKKFQQPEGRDRYLTQDEARRFLEALDSAGNIVIASGLRMLLFTGLRCREVFDLKWEDVIEETHSVFLRRTKSGKSRRVCLSSVAWTEIERMRDYRRADHPYVFPGKMANTPVLQPQRTFAAVLKVAGIKDFRIHDLRHTFASHMVQSGATLFEVQSSLGHSSAAMSQRYAHLSDTGLRERAHQTAQRLIGNSEQES